MEVTGEKWLEEAEASLLSLRDIEGVSILAEAGVIREIHILATPGRSAKQIVRDIETCLRTRYSMGIDHRVVSVAFSKVQPAAAKPAVEPTAAKPAVELEAAKPAVEQAMPAPAPASLEAPLATPAPRNGSSGEARERAAESAGNDPSPREDARIRFSAANLYVAGPRVQAQVELRWKGIGRMGSATGWSSRDASHRLIAQATLAAVQEFLEEAWALSLQDIEFVRVGRHEVVLVGLSLITHRHEKLLAGCCPVEQDAQQAVVLATLGAVNRVVGGLPTREPTEFVLRPASRLEESGAKKS
jgi:hypothetical protein